MQTLMELEGPLLLWSGGCAPRVVLTKQMPVGLYREVAGSNQFAE